MCVCVCRFGDMCTMYVGAVRWWGNDGPFAELDVEGGGWKVVSVAINNKN